MNEQKALETQRNACTQTDFPEDNTTLASLKETCNFLFYIITKSAFVPLFFIVKTANFVVFPLVFNDFRGFLHAERGSRQPFAV